MADELLEQGAWGRVGTYLGHVHGLLELPGADVRGAHAGRQRSRGAAHDDGNGWKWLW